MRAPDLPLTGSGWLRRFHPAGGAAGGLVCFPHVGGSASYFFPLSRAMAPQVEVFAVQYPGRQNRRAEPCVGDVHEIADRVVDELATWDGRPLALFGHSLGATVAFEVARRRQDRGQPPSVLFASGRRAPSRRGTTERLHLSSDERLAATIRRLNGTDSAVLANDRMLRSLLPAIRADFTAAETYRYRPGPPLACPVVVMTGATDPVVTEEEAAAWAKHTAMSCELLRFPGGHFYLSEQWDDIAVLIRARCDTSAPDGVELQAGAAVVAPRSRPA
jgi:surfactin synthase thioesterase subunit